LEAGPLFLGGNRQGNDLLRSLEGAGIFVNRYTDLFPLPFQSPVWRYNAALQRQWLNLLVDKAGADRWSLIHHVPSDLLTAGGQYAYDLFLTADDPDHVLRRTRRPIFRSVH
jgi:hypothetical protein